MMGLPLQQRSALSLGLDENGPLQVCSSRPSGPSSVLKVSKPKHPPAFKMITGAGQSPPRAFAVAAGQRGGLGSDAALGWLPLGFLLGGGPGGRNRQAPPRGLGQPRRPRALGTKQRGNHENAPVIGEFNKGRHSPQQPRTAAPLQPAVVSIGLTTKPEVPRTGGT